jgi:hypothetical protein
VTHSEIISTLLARWSMPPIGVRAYDLCVGAVRNSTTSDLFDDVGWYAWRDQDNGPIQVRLWRCTTDPGKAALLAPMNAGGTFRLRADYRHKGLWALGNHKGDPARPSFVQVGTAVGERDNDKNGVFDQPKPANDGGGVNHHNGMRKGDLTQSIGRYSYGCVVTSEEDLAVGRRLLAEQKARGMGGVCSLHLFNRATNPDSAPLFAAVGVAL